jgi:hypothetical protein
METQIETHEQTLKDRYTQVTSALTLNLTTNPNPNPNLNQS